jgi:hypothetical protein
MQRGCAVDLLSTVQEASQAGSSESFSPDETWQAQAVLMDAYHAQTLCWQVGKGTVCLRAGMGGFLCRPRCWAR